MLLLNITQSICWQWKTSFLQSISRLRSPSKTNFLSKASSSLLLILRSLKNDDNNMINDVYKDKNLIFDNNSNNNHDISSSNNNNNNRLGTIALVGAGPGDPNLLTLKALNVLKKADLVIADRLISQEILDMITCELLIAKKRPGCADEAQDEIYQWVHDAVIKGKNVVRLKIGDPLLFGRGGEEILEFRQKLGINPMIVPGISSSYAAPLSAGIPLTHRGVSSQVLISTGYGKNLSYVDIPEYHADRTIVLLMAVGRIGEIANNMTSIMGYPIDTPVAIIEKATTINQRIILGSLKNISSIAIEEQAKAPATIIIGEVVNVLNDCNFATTIDFQNTDENNYNLKTSNTSIYQAPILQ